MSSDSTIEFATQDERTEYLNREHPDRLTDAQVPGLFWNPDGSSVGVFCLEVWVNPPTPEGKRAYKRRLKAKEKHEAEIDREVQRERDALQRLQGRI